MPSAVSSGRWPPGRGWEVASPSVVARVGALRMVAGSRMVAPASAARPDYMSSRRITLRLPAHVVIGYNWRGV
jgi:hypothetical protein